MNRKKEAAAGKRKRDKRIEKAARSVGSKLARQKSVFDSFYCFWNQKKEESLMDHIRKRGNPIHLKTNWFKKMRCLEKSDSFCSPV